MATTIQNATLTVVVTETLSLGGTQYGGTKTLEISSINEVFGYRRCCYIVSGKTWCG